MKVYPLAIYTADHGLAWNYPRDEISFQDIDSCRKAFGPLPDFDSGAMGFEGIWANGNRVYIMRCQSVSAWDFRGRNATYLSVTWIPRTEAAATDFEKILATEAMSVPTKNPPPFFEADASVKSIPAIPPEPFLSDGFARAGAIIAGTSVASVVSIKRARGCTQASCSVSNDRGTTACRVVDVAAASTPLYSHPNATSKIASVVAVISVLWFLTAAATVIFAFKWNSEMCKSKKQQQELLETKARVKLLENQLKTLSNQTNDVFHLSPRFPANEGLQPFLWEPFGSVPHVIIYRTF